MVVRGFGRVHGFDARAELPAGCFWQFGPDRHSTEDDSIGQQPEKRTRCCVLHWRFQKAGAFARAFASATVTIGAMLIVKRGARGYCVLVMGQRIRPIAIL